MKKNFNCLTLFLILISPLSFAQDPQGPVSVDRAVELAVENNLELQSQAIDLGIKKRGADTVWNQFIPTVSASATLSKLNVDPIPLGPGPAASPWNLNTNLSAQLALSPALFPGITQTRIDYQNGLVNYEGARAQLEVEVRKAFNTLLALRQDLALTEDQLENARQRYLETQLNYDAGLSSELTLLSSRVTWENLKPSLLDKTNAYNASLLSFKNQLGFTSELDLVLEGEISIPENLTLPSLESLLSGLENRYDIQGLSGELAGLENTLLVQQMALLPNVILAANWDPGMNNPLETNWFDDIDNTWSQRSGNMSLTLSWAIDPFLPGSQTQVALSNLQDNLSQLQTTYQSAYKGAELQVRTLYATVQKSLESLKALGFNLDLAQRAFTLSEEAYRAGSQSLLEVQDAELQLRGARLQLIFEELSLVNGIIDLEFALGLEPGQLLSVKENLPSGTEDGENND
jgi:outer membrane protein TolC